MKNLFLVGILLVSGSALAGNSLEFGERNANGVAPINVYVDANEPAPRCLCDRFNVLVADRTGAIGGTFISKVMILAEGKNKTELVEAESLSALYRHPSSPAKTNQFIFEKMGRSGFIYTVLAMKRKCMNPTVAECKKNIVDVKGKFTSKDLSTLSPVKATVAGR